MTLIELLVILVIIGIVAGFATSRLSRALYLAKISRAAADIRAIHDAIEMYSFERRVHGPLSNPQWRNRYSYYPPSLHDLVPRYLEALPIDPWGREYDYLNFDVSDNDMRKDGPVVPLNSKFDLFSAGPNGLWKDDINTWQSSDDVIFGADGAYIGTCENWFEP
jgi:general secretion pathway protein G